MKRNETTKLLVVALLLIAGALSAVSQTRRPPVYGIMFYNLENLFDTINNNGKYDLEFSPEGRNKWDGKKYKKKLQNMAYAISQMRTTKEETQPVWPVLIGVSEIENKSVLDDLVAQESIAHIGYKVIHHDSPDRRGVDVGMLYDPAFFRPINVTNHTLRIEGMPNFRTRDQMCVVGLLDRTEPIAVIVNHWPSRRGGSEQSSYLREAAAALSKSIADSLLNLYPDMPVIVMGDLNDDPSDRSCADVLGAQKKQSDVAPGGFFNPFWTLLDNGIGSYCYRGGWDLFDQIIVNHNLLSDGNSKFLFLKAVVLNKEFLKQPDGQYKGYPFRTYSGGAFLGGYSDHFPTEIFLVKRKKK